MAKTLFRMLPLAVAMMGVLTVPVLAVHGGGGGGFRGGGAGFRGGFHGGFRGGGMHGGHGFHRGHGGHRDHGHHRHHRHGRFRNFNQFANVSFGGWGWGGYYPYDYYNSDAYGSGEVLVPVAPATPVLKGYSTYYSADGVYNYPRFYNPCAAPTQVIVNNYCPEKSGRKYHRKGYKKSRPCPPQPSSVAEKLKNGGK